MDKDSQYYIIFTQAEGGGGDYFEFGYIYHGTNPDSNMEHGTGMTKAVVDNLPEITYVRVSHSFGFKM